MQRKRERILFLCTANIDRSPTAEDLYAGDARYHVLSAGIAPYATVPVTRQMLEWADRVFVMNERHDHHKSELVRRFPELELEVVDLDVQDLWYRGDPILVAVLRERLEPHLGPPQTD